MKTFVFVFLVLILPLSLWSQEIEILTKNPDFEPGKKPSDFFYVSKSLDSSLGMKVADVRLTAKREGRDKSLAPMYYKFRKEAMKMGANAFFMTKMSYFEEEKEYEIFIELWSLNDDEIEENLSLMPTNQLIIIGNIDTKNESKGKGFKLNKEKTDLMPYSYILCQNEVGEKISVSVGGFTGASMSTTGAEGKLPVFIALGGVAVAPMVMVPNGGVGISINTGNVFPLDMDLGFFLMDILDLEKQELSESTESQEEQ